MTKSLILTTSADKTEVDKAIRKVGFKEPTKFGDSYAHKTVDDIVLQIHAKGNRIIGMEFDDRSDRLPDNPEAFKVLRALYDELSDLMYSEYSFPPKPIPDGPLSEYLDSIN